MVVSRPVGCPRPARVRQKSMASSAQVLGLRVIRVAGVGLAGGAGKLEREGLAVAASPLGDDVSDDAAVVAGGELDRPVKGAGCVGAVHPQVTQVDGVDEVAELPGLVYWPVDRQSCVIAHERWRAGPAAHGLRRGRREPLDDLSRVEVSAVVEPARPRGRLRAARRAAGGGRGPAATDGRSRESTRRIRTRQARAGTSRVCSRPGRPSARSTQRHPAIGAARACGRVHAPEGASPRRVSAVRWC